MRWRLTLLALGCVVAIARDPQTRIRGYLSSPEASAPGGFMVEASDTASRTIYSSGTVNALVPSTRGVFTFAAPYGTKAWRVTDTTDCSGDCQNFGYALWGRINNSSGQNLIRVLVPQSKSTGGGGPTLFTINKTTDEVLKVGAIFASGNVRSDETCEQCFWHSSNPDLFFNPTDADPFISPWEQIELCDISGSLPITPGTACTTVVDMTSSAAITAFGSGREAWIIGASWDGNVIGFIVQNGGTSEGCGYRNVSLNTYTFVDSLRGTADDVQGCGPSRSGTYGVMQDVNTGGAQTTRMVKLSDLTDVRCVNGSASTNCDAASHSDNLWLGQLMFDGWESGTSIKYYDATSTPTSGPRTLAWLGSGFGAAHCNFVSSGNSDGTTGNDHAICGETTSTAAVRANEIQGFRARQFGGDGTDILIAGQWLGTSSGYTESPFPNLSPDGNYVLWASNHHGSRMDTFVLWLPKQLLYGGLPQPAPRPLQTARLWLPQSLRDGHLLTALGLRPTLKVRVTRTAIAVTVSER